ncbi:MAG: hypothetical protein OXB94_05270 [Nitrospira sp.]|nr:hypothetical protein [Nitrospira sp.]
MEITWLQGLGIALTFASLVVAVLAWLGVAPMTAATWFAPIFVGISLFALTYWGVQRWPTITISVAMGVLVSLVLYGLISRSQAPAPTDPTTPERGLGLLDLIDGAGINGLGSSRDDRRERYRTVSSGLVPSGPRPIYQREENAVGADVVQF